MNLPPNIQRNGNCSRIVSRYLQKGRSKDKRERVNIRKRERVPIEQRIMIEQRQLCIAYRCLVMKYVSVGLFDLENRCCANCEINEYVQKTLPFERMLARKPELDHEYRIICKVLKNKYDIDKRMGEGNMKLPPDIRRAEGCVKIIESWFDIRSPGNTWTRNQIRKMEKDSIDKRTIQYQVRLCILYHILAYHTSCIHTENILTQYCSNCEIHTFIHENEELDNLLTRKAEIEAEYKVICESLKNAGVKA